MIGPVPRSGMLRMHKPPGVTSRRVVDRVRRAVASRRVGHAGTLDPFAEGLLLVAWDKATALVPYLHIYPKTYLVTAEFGRVTDTQDRTGATIATADPSGITTGAIESALAGFRGKVLQIPPMFSAVKHRGRRLYEFAREGKEVERPSREREVYRFELCTWEAPRATFEVQCAGGTYIRTLIHDLGRVLGPGATVTELLRTTVGPHRLEGALSLEELESLDGDALLARRISLAEVLPDWPRVTVEEPREADAIRCGSWTDPRGLLAAGGEYRITSAAGGLLALARGGERTRLLRVLGEQ